jgi:hypothetical protein
MIRAWKALSQNTGSFVNRNPFDFFDGYFIARAIAKCRRPQRFLRAIAWVFSIMVSFSKEEMIPVARNVWQQVELGKEAAATRTV